MKCAQKYLNKLYFTAATIVDLQENRKKIEFLEYKVQDCFGLKDVCGGGDELSTGQTTCRRPTSRCQGGRVSLKSSWPGQLGLTKCFTF